MTQTASEVFIQRSSLVKRLDKIRRLTGDDLADPDTRLYYRICFRLMKN
ncbi:MAG: helix-turn-helix domain-containing protein [Treponema sp.]|nr:helix-turn-helix domain-containing protein [Treponema sp.]